MSSSESPFISLKNYTEPKINVNHFYAIKEFERRHPSLYRNAIRPTFTSQFSLVFQHQTDAFQRVSNDPKYANKLEQIRKEVCQNRQKDLARQSKKKVR